MLRFSSNIAGPSSWNRCAAATASTRSLNSDGTSAESVMAMRSRRCSLRGPSSGLYVAISSGLQLQKEGGGGWSAGELESLRVSQG